MALVRHQICAHVLRDGRIDIVSENLSVNILTIIIGMEQLVPYRFVPYRVKIMEHVRHQTFAIGRYIFLDKCSSILHFLAQVHGTVVLVKNVRNNRLALSLNIFYMIDYFSAVCNPPCLNGGNCTSPNTCVCEFFHL